MATKFPGSQAVVYVMREVTYGSPRKPTGVEAIRTLSETFTPTQERDNRPDRTSTADYQDQYTGRWGATWEVQKLLMPNGNVTTMPDDFRLWDAGMGRTSVGVTSINFLQATSHMTSLTIRRGVRGDGTSAGEFQEHVAGAIVNKIDVAWGSQGQNGLATVTFGGMAKRWGFSGNSSLNNTRLLTTALVVTLDAARQFTEGGVFMIKRPDGTNVDSGGGSGMLITNANITTKKLTFTVAAALSSTHSDNDLVRAWNPVPVTAGQPMHAKFGYLSLNASATVVKHLGGRITMENGLGLLNDEVGTDSATEVIRESKYKTTVSLDFLMKREEVADLLGSAYDEATAGKIQVTLGNETGGRFEFVMPQVQWDMVSPEIPAEGDARITMSGRAYAVNGQDSFKVRIK